MKARQKLLAAAGALALSLTASAQTPPAETPAAPPPATEAPPPKPPETAKPAEPKAPAVQVYGTLNVNLQRTEASGATTVAQNVKPRFAVSIDSSNIGVRGTLDLVHGVKGTYQCETQASIDGEDTRALCNRNSRVGLTGDFGTIFYGNWDTPFKAMAYGTKADDPFLNTDVYGFNGIMGSPGYGTRSSAWITATPSPTAGTGTTASFDQRAANSVAYWTPKFSGLSAKFQWGVDEFRNADGVIQPMLLSGVVNYDMGPLSVAGSVEYHEDAYGLRNINAANTNLSSSKDWAWRVAAGYELPLSSDSFIGVNGMVDQLIYKQNDATLATAFKEYKRFAWYVGAHYRAGPHEIKARYTQAMDPDITQVTGTANEKDLGATSWAVGYAYHLAKSTQVYAYYTEIDNASRAKYTFPVSGAATLVGANTPVGSKLSAGGLGIRLAF